MSQLTITLSDDLETEVRQYVRGHGYASVSDFVREALSRTVSGRPSYWERAHLAHMMEIKKELGGDINDELLDALKSGYPRYYSFEEYHVAKEEMAEDSMRFVEDVLGMYADLQRSYKDSPEKDKIVEDDLVFPGFDGNAGDGHLGYLGFLVRHGRFTYVEPLGAGHPINSHSTVTYIYERMLETYKSIKREDAFDRRPLTLAEIKEVIGSRIHPENR